MHSIPATADLADTPLNMLPPGSSGPYPAETQPQKARQLNPRASLDDYNRVMLEYTKRRMSTFADVDGGRHGSPSSDSSRSSGNSSTSTSGVLAHQVTPGVPVSSSDGAKSSKEAILS